MRVMGIACSSLELCPGNRHDPHNLFGAGLAVVETFVSKLAFLSSTTWIVVGACLESVDTVSLLLANAWSCSRRSMSSFVTILGTEIEHPEYVLP